MGLEPGTIIGGKYSVTQRLGVGGMGEVWSGQSLADGSPVAVKIMLSAAALTREVWARFKREAQVLGRIQSDYVARVLDFVSDPQHGLALVMELIPGQPFSAILASEGRISVEAMTLIAVDVTRGLADLHAAKVVHRDMKPGNIVLNPRPGERDRAMIIDFGVSRILSDEGEEEVTAITRDDRVLGTLEYMAPEQVLGSRTVTPVADLYAMGAMMYRAVAGHHVFGDLVEGKLVAAKLNEEAPRLETGRKDPASQRFASLVAKLLSRRPKQRIQTAEELLLELETIEELLFTPLTMPLIHVQFEEDPLPDDDDDELPTAALSPEQRAQIMLRQARSMAQQRKSALAGVVAAKEISVGSGATTQRLDSEVSVSVSESEISIDTTAEAIHPALQKPAPIPDSALLQPSHGPSPSPSTPSQGYAAGVPVESPSGTRAPISSSHERFAPEAMPAPAQGRARLSLGMVTAISALVVTAAVVGGVVGASVATRRSEPAAAAASAPSNPTAETASAVAAPPSTPEPTPAATASAPPSPSAAPDEVATAAAPTAEPPVTAAPARPKRAAPPRMYAPPKPPTASATPATASPESPPAPTPAPTPLLPDQP